MSAGRVNNLVRSQTEYDFKQLESVASENRGHVNFANGKFGKFNNHSIFVNCSWNRKTLTPMANHEVRRNIVKCLQQQYQFSEDSRIQERIRDAEKFLLETDEYRDLSRSDLRLVLEYVKNGTNAAKLKGRINASEGSGSQGGNVGNAGARGSVTQLHVELTKKVATMLTRVLGSKVSAEELGKMAVLIEGKLATSWKCKWGIAAYRENGDGRVADNVKAKFDEKLRQVEATLANTVGKQKNPTNEQITKCLNLACSKKDANSLEEMSRLRKEICLSPQSEIDPYALDEDVKKKLREEGGNETSSDRTQFRRNGLAKLATAWRKSNYGTGNTGERDLEAIWAKSMKLIEALLKKVRARAEYCKEDVSKGNNPYGRVDKDETDFFNNIKSAKPKQLEKWLSSLGDPEDEGFQKRLGKLFGEKSLDQIAQDIKAIQVD